MEIQALKLEKEKRFSQELLKKQKLFMNHAVHETITPLTAIMNNIELYEMNNKPNVYMSNIEASMKNVFNIYDDLSYIVKKDQVDYPKHKLNLVNFIQSRIDFFMQVANQNKLNLIFTSFNDELIVNVNETKLQRIIDNNITNAIKYTHSNENINVVLEKSNKDYILYFASKSTHIQYPHKVFEAYYRESHKEKGFGLGLNLVKKICDEENIKITLDSDDLQTKFSYTFMVED